MKKISFTLLALFIWLPTTFATKPPTDWGDFKFGLVSENLPILKERFKQALAEDIELSYRYIYINNGVDQSSNALSWLFTEWGNYAQESIDIGVKPAYVIYMLQEEGGRSTLLNNINNVDFMKKYFDNVKTVAQKSNGMKSIFILEPDTWGYYLQEGLESGLNIDPTLESAKVSNLGAGYEWLNGLPNNLSGVVQGLIKTIRTYAPDAYCGILMSHWAVSANGKTGPSTPNGNKGMVYWNISDVEYSAVANANFAQELLGNEDRGDFIGVEKNGWSAGRWAKEGSDFWYWGDNENANWVNWVNKLTEIINMPALGWQISIGHMGLPNENNSYEDTFFPYFFNNTQDFIDAGLIGFLVGKGLADDTDFTNLNGNNLDPNDGEKGDRGWFLEQLKEFDKNRPYLTKSTKVTAPQTSPNIVITNNLLAYTSNNTSIGQFEIYNITGQQIYSNNSDQYKIDIQAINLPKGIYFFKSKFQVAKFVVR